MLASTDEDLPQMWQRPAFEELLQVLAQLELQLPTWNSAISASSSLPTHTGLLSDQRKSEVTRYLSSIVSSPLLWLRDDDQREQIWTQASKRMSERCGRTAMGELTRRWTLCYDDDPESTFELVIKEPALTGDSLGLKTWGSAYVFSQALTRIANTSLSSFFDGTQDSLDGPKVLELGSGTGLLGLAAAALWKTQVTLTDLPSIVPNLRANAKQNEALVCSGGGEVLVGPLTWGGSDEEIDPVLFSDPFQYNVIICADPLYDEQHPNLLASTIAQHLAKGDKSRALVMVPKRDDATVSLLESFKAAMLSQRHSLQCLEESELAGQDDWVEDSTGGHMRCWLGIFSR